MRKDSTTAKLTEFEIDRNKNISKVRYIVEQYFGINHLKYCAKRARFAELVKNRVNGWLRQSAYNIFRGLKILGPIPFRSRPRIPKPVFLLRFFRSACIVHIVLSKKT